MLCTAEPALNPPPNPLSYQPTPFYRNNLNLNLSFTSIIPTGGESPFRQSRSNSTHNTGPHSTHSQRSSRSTSMNNSRRGSDPQAVNRQIQTPVLDRIGNFFNRLTSNTTAYDAIPESLTTGSHPNVNHEDTGTILSFSRWMNDSINEILLDPLP